MNPADQHNAGKKIKEHRLAQNLTQEQLGALCEPPMAGSAIRRYENNKTLPKIQTLQRIAKALNVPVDEIRSDSDLDFDYMMGLIKKIDFVPATKTTVKVNGVDNPYLGQIVTSFTKLNEKGQEKAASYVEDLTKIPEYKKTE